MKKLTSAFACILLLLLLCGRSTFGQVPGDEHWDNRFDYPGTTNIVFALAAIDGKIYSSGITLQNGSSATNSIDIWDGNDWKSLANASYAVYDLCKVGTDLYVAGIFSQINGNTNVGLAKWDGTKWSNVGGFKGTALALATDGSNLYVGGAITNAGGVAAANVAKWDGANWSALGAGLSPADGTTINFVRNLLYTNGLLYAVGSFSNSAGTAMQGIAVWNGTTWSAVGGSLNGEADCITYDGANLYVGGIFTQAGGLTVNRIARWDGANWSSLGGVSSGGVNAAAYLNGTLYIGGTFTNVAGVTATRIAKYNGSWSALGVGMGDQVNKMIVAGTNVVIGGNFTTADGLIVYHVCLYDGTDFHRMVAAGHIGQGAGNFGRSIAVKGNDVYLGGLAMTGVGDARVSCIAHFDGVKWSDMNGGVKGTNTSSGTAVNVITIAGNYVYVGGLFTNAGGVSANNIARWDGTNWSALGSGVTGGSVSAIAVDGNNVYVGGNFDHAGGLSVFGIARFDGANWFPIPGAYASAQTNTAFNTIVTNGAGGIYAGGTFVVGNNLGGYSTNIAMNNGNGWIGLGAALNNGMNSNVNAIVTSGTNVYAAGRFTLASGVVANRIAKWNGTTWSPLGTGLGGNVSVSIGSLAMVANYLVAAGSNFTNAGPNTVNVIAAWDGAQWTAMGQGLKRPGASATAAGSVGLNGLAADGNDLYVAGIFEQAGNSTSFNIAHWNPTKILTPLNFRLANVAWNGAGAHFMVSGTGEQFYDVQSSVDLINWTTILRTNIAEFDYSVPTAAGARFYRAWYER
jgi:trimeric autotransporter adhesin